jgi:hypothetical protein
MGENIQMFKEHVKRVVRVGLKKKQTGNEYI